MGPLEIEIRRLAKQIDEMDLEVVKLQRHWMKQQRELVKLSEERDEQLASLDMLKKEITIKEQKKIRIESKCDASCEAGNQIFRAPALVE